VNGGERGAGTRAGPGSEASVIEVRECVCGWWVACYGAWEVEREDPYEAVADVLREAMRG
jgi:hypothetical protein